MMSRIDVGGRRRAGVLPAIARLFPGARAGQAGRVTVKRMLPNFRFVIGAVLATMLLAVAGLGLFTATRLTHQAKVGPLETSRNLAFDDRSDWNQFYDPENARRFEELVRRSDSAAQQAADAPAEAPPAGAAVVVVVPPSDAPPPLDLSAAGLNAAEWAAPATTVPATPEPPRVTPTEEAAAPGRVDEPRETGALTPASDVQPSRGEEATPIMPDAPPEPAEEAPTAPASTTESEAPKTESKTDSKSQTKTDKPAPTPRAKPAAAPAERKAKPVARAPVRAPAPKPRVAAPAQQLQPQQQYWQQQQNWQQQQWQQQQYAPRRQNDPLAQPYSRPTPQFGG